MIWHDVKSFNACVNKKIKPSTIISWPLHSSQSPFSHSEHNYLFNRINSKNPRRRKKTDHPQHRIFWKIISTASISDGQNRFSMYVFIFFHLGTNGSAEKIESFVALISLNEREAELDWIHHCRCSRRIPCQPRQRSNQCSPTRCQQLPSFNISVHYPIPHCQRVYRSVDRMGSTRRQPTSLPLANQISSISVRSTVWRSSVN